MRRARAGRDAAAAAGRRPRRGPVRAALRALRRAAVTRSWCPRNAPLGPRNVYAATKVAQEHLAGSWARATGGPGGGAALSQRVRPGDAARYAVRRGGVVLPLRPGGRPRAAGLRGRSPATGLRPRPRRRRRHRRRAGRAHQAGRPRRPGHPARLQRGQRHPAHRRRAGVGAGRRLRRPGPGHHRRVPARRRPARHRVQRAHLAGTALAGEPCRSPRGSQSSPRTPAGRRAQA